MPKAKETPKRRKSTPKMKGSKGDFFDFIRDASEDKELFERMKTVIASKGEHETPETLLKRFIDLGYDEVSLNVCTRLLEAIKKGAVAPERWDYHY